MDLLCILVYEITLYIGVMDLPCIYIKLKKKPNTIRAYLPFATEIRGASIWWGVI
jgi:hypothetical protein